MLANVDITAMAIPDFVAGFVFGMTGNNDLEEIESCYAGGELMDQEIELGIADIKKGGVDNDIQAGLQFALAAVQIPQALSTCENMGDDLTAIEEWASIFKNPEALASKLATHYALHHKEIQSDLSTLETEWDAQQYFQAGKELADIATLAIGPIKKNTYGTASCSLPNGDTYSLSTTEIADYLAGFMGGFTGNNHKTEMEACFHDTDTFESDICGLVVDFASKDNQQVLSAIQKILQTDLPQLKTFMAGCPTVATDWTVVANWFKYWKAQGEMKVYSEGYHNLIQHLADLKTDASTLEGFYDARDYYNTGLEASTMAKIVLPVAATEYEFADEKLPCPDNFKMNSTIIADSVAGLMMSFTGHDDHAEMEACFEDSPEFEADICDAFSNMKTKDNQKVLAAIQHIIADLPEFNQYMSKCEGKGTITADFNVVADWFKYWKAKGMMAVYQTAYKHAIPNMKTIKDEWHQNHVLWGEGHYFEGAQHVANIAKLLLPVAGEEVAFLQ